MLFFDAPQDVNDNQPKFKSPSYKFSVKEGQKGKDFGYKSFTFLPLELEMTKFCGFHQVPLWGPFTPRIWIKVPTLTEFLSASLMAALAASLFRAPPTQRATEETSLWTQTSSWTTRAPVNGSR